MQRMSLCPRGQKWSLGGREGPLIIMGRNLRRAKSEKANERQRKVMEIKKLRGEIERCWKEREREE